MKNYFFSHMSYNNSSRRSADWPEPNNLIEWKDLNDVGNFLGTGVGSNVKVYKKRLEAGFHTVDDTSAIYLFQLKGINQNVESIQYV
jgi:hypothetical protein